MNRLQLAQRLRQDAGIGGTGPATTISQSGELKRVVDWIDDAWNEIQQQSRWGFLWEAATVTVLANTGETAGTIAAARYDIDATYQGSTLLAYRPWAQFRADYPSALIVAGVPSVWSIRPDKAFVVNAKPTANTAYSVERWKNPIPMTADADIPALAAEHHMMIVHKAMLLYCNFEEAGVSRATTLREYQRHMTALGLVELPDFELAAPLM